MHHRCYRYLPHAPCKAHAEFYVVNDHTCLGSRRPHAALGYVQTALSQVHGQDVLIWSETTAKKYRLSKFDASLSLLEELSPVPSHKSIGLAQDCRIILASR